MWRISGFSAEKISFMGNWQVYQIGSPWANGRKSLFLLGTSTLHYGFHFPYSLTVVVNCDIWQPWADARCNMAAERAQFDQVIAYNIRILIYFVYVILLAMQESLTLSIRFRNREYSTVEMENIVISVRWNYVGKLAVASFTPMILDGFLSKTIDSHR